MSIEDYNDLMWASVQQLNAVQVYVDRINKLRVRHGQEVFALSGLHHDNAARALAIANFGSEPDIFATLAPHDLLNGIVTLQYAIPDRCTPLYRELDMIREKVKRTLHTVRRNHELRGATKLIGKRSRRIG